MADFILGEKVISAVEGGTTFGTIETSNILTEAPLTAPSGRRISWSGWMGASISDRDHRTWSKEAWTALDRWCDAVLPDLDGATVCFRPHPRHVLSDPQSCLSFLRRRQGQPFEVLLDPAGFLTADMLPRAEDHLRRALAALAGHEMVPAVVVANLAQAGDELLAPVPVDRGLLDQRLVRLIASCIPASKGRVFVGPDVPGQLRAIATS